MKHKYSTLFENSMKTNENVQKIATDYDASMYSTVKFDWISFVDQSKMRTTLNHMDF